MLGPYQQVQTIKQAREAAEPEVDAFIPEELEREFSGKVGTFTLSRRRYTRLNSMYA